MNAAPDRRTESNRSLERTGLELAHSQTSCAGRSGMAFGDTAAPPSGASILAERLGATEIAGLRC